MITARPHAVATEICTPNFGDVHPMRAGFLRSPANRSSIQSHSVRRLTLLCLLSLSLPAVAGEVRVRGTRKPVFVRGEVEAYHPIGIGWPVDAIVVGPGDLALGLRVQVAEAGEGRATVRVSVDGSEILQVPLEGAAAGRFRGQHPTAPGPLVARRIRIGEGRHEVVISAQGGSAVVSLRLQGSPPAALALAPLAPAPLAPEPLAAAPLEAAPLTLSPAPLTAEPLAPSAPAKRSPKAKATLALSPHPPPDSTAEPPSGATASSVDRGSGRTIQYSLLGGAALFAVGAGVSYGLAAGANGEYRATPEVRSGASTSRQEILARANNELAWAQGLGATMVLLLAGAAISFTF